MRWSSLNRNATPRSGRSTAMDEQTGGKANDIAARLGLGRTRMSRPGRKRLFFFGGAGLVLIVLTIVFVSRSGAPSYVTEPARRGDLVVTVSATGTLQPLNQVDVGAEISGRIVALHADFNDHVHKGDLLAELDTEELKARLVQSEAAVVNAQATVTETRAKRNRIAALRKSGTSSKEDLDIAQAAFERAQAALTQAEALRDVDRTNLARAQIRAPIDGIVLDRKVEVGQTMAATFQTPILFTLAEDLTHMRLHVDVDEADVGRVKEGDLARFSVDAYPDREFSATVHEFRNAPHTSEGVVTYEAVLDVDNRDLALRPGMTATADIEGTRIANALLVPNGALRFTPPGYNVKREGTADGLPKLSAIKVKSSMAGQALPNLGRGIGVVWTRDGHRPVPHALRLGASDGLSTVVEAGALKDAEPVLVDLVQKGETGP